MWCKPKLTPASASAWSGPSSRASGRERWVRASSSGAGLAHGAWTTRNWTDRDLAGCAAALPTACLRWKEEKDDRERPMASYTT